MSEETLNQMNKDSKEMSSKPETKVFEAYMFEAHTTQVENLVWA